MFFDYLQKSFEIPKILIQILNLVGYDNPIAIELLNAENIVEIEKYVAINLKHALVDSVYSNMKQFSFLPGHKAILLSLPSYVDKFDQFIRKNNKDCFVDTLPLSYIMKELIKTGIKNHGRDKKHNQFPVEIKHWAAYMYMMCGKACYEILCENLPLPLANTICKLHCNKHLLMFLAYKMAQSNFFHFDFSL